MESTIDLNGALALLKRRYEREKSEYKDVTVTFGVKDQRMMSSGWGECDRVPYTIHVLCAEIIYYKEYEGLRIKNIDTKDGYALEGDLLKELNRMYENEDFYVTDVFMPTIFRSKKIEGEREVRLQCKKKDKGYAKKLV